MKPLAPTFLKLVALLNDGHYHDGVSLGAHLKVSRNAVWKMVKKLEQYDIPIQAKKGVGYALREPLLLLNQKTLKKALKEQAEVMLFESIDSTQTYVETHKNERTIACFAEAQSLPRGRLGRTWYAPFGKNIYCSIGTWFKKDVSMLSGLSLVVSLAIIRALEESVGMTALDAKWPNDVFYQHQKLAGNLITVQAESNGQCRLIIGMGINVNMLHDHKTRSISQPWISLQEIVKQSLDRNVIAIALVKTIFSYLERFKTHGLVAFLKEWEVRDYLRKKYITLDHPNDQRQGKMMGINHLGHLILEAKDGTLHTISAGDTKVLWHEHDPSP